MPSTNGKMQQWQPRMPSWMSRSVRRWNNESTSASLPPQYGQRRTSRVSISMGDFAEMLEHRIAGRVERGAGELLEAEPAARFVLVDPGDRVVRPHLGAMAAKRGQLAHRPVADVD